MMDTNINKPRLRLPPYLFAE